MSGGISGRVRVGGLGFIAGAIALLTVGLNAPAADAAGKPDLKVTEVQALNPAPTQGAAIQVQATVQNAGKKTAKKSLLGFHISTDRKLGKGDQALGGTLKVKKLKKGKSAVVNGSVTIPGAVKPGGYELLACADDKSRVKETKEANNCGAAPTGLGIRQAAKPVNVSPRLDGANASSSPVSMSGGYAFAFGADGTTYTLVVPDGALTHDAEITMTPLAGVDSLPFSGGLVAGVQIDTDRLQLAKPAQLIIQRDGLAPSPSQVAFGFHDGGEGLFVTPFGQRPAGYPDSAIAIPVLHGGGWGIANAAGPELDTQRSKPPVRTEDRLAQAVTGPGGPPAARPAARRAFDIDTLRATARQMYDQVIRPEMTAAETNDAILPQASADAFGWMRTLVLLGVDDEFSGEFAQIMASLEKAVEHAYQKAKERCIAGDFTQVSKLISIERFRQLL